MSARCKPSILTLEDGLQTLPQGVLVHEVLEQLFTLQGDDRDTLEIGAVQSLVGCDVNLVRLESQLAWSPRNTTRASTQRWQSGLE